MPELPEVETIRTALSDVLVGQSIEKLIFHRKDLRDPFPKSALRKILLHQEILSVERRSKYILINTKKGQAVVHLGMTGVFHYHDTEKPQVDHTHFVLAAKKQGQATKYLHYIDPRRFGRFGAIGQGAEKWLANLGPEPLNSFEELVESLFEKSRRRKQPIKSFIMDPKNVVGVGNIYAAEALFRTKLNPFKAAGLISKKSYEEMSRHIVDVLKEAIKQGGTTFRDFRDINGQSGYFRIHLDVYGREGEPCRRCKGRISREMMAGRSTFYCAGCQK